ncbi:hypothetical protein MTO96_030660 [Rhipicephalus appendiculatus]
MANLRVRTQGVEIIQARMKGDTKSATLTFCGPTLQRFVYYCGGELACQPYRATVQVCKTRCSKGHRTDVCPQPDARVCHICGTRDPTDGHMCVPKCASCGGEHVTGDRSCTQRLKQPRATARKPKRPPSPKRKELRWFSSEEEESELSDDRKPRSASRHRTPTRHDGKATRACSKSPPPRKSRSRSRSWKRATSRPRRKAEESQTPVRASAEPVRQQQQAPSTTMPELVKVLVGLRRFVDCVLSQPRPVKKPLDVCVERSVQELMNLPVLSCGNTDSDHCKVLLKLIERKFIKPLFCKLRARENRQECCCEVTSEKAPVKKNLEIVGVCSPRSARCIAPQRRLLLHKRLRFETLLRKVSAAFVPGQQLQSSNVHGSL